MADTEKIVEAFIDRLASEIEPSALREFGQIERLSLKLSLLKCRLAEYPPVMGREDGERCSGEIICPMCENDYYSHPMDWRVIGYGNVPFLNVLCSGERVKL